MIDKKELTEVVNRALEGSDLFLVQVTVSSDNVIDVALDSAGDISIDDCVRVDKAVHAAFDQDVEDYELTVGSYGIAEPYKVHEHYLKNVGGPVEVLTRAGEKLKGTLKAAGDSDFTVTVLKKVKLEGKKRPEMVEQDVTLAYDEIKYTKNIITV